MVSRKLSPEHEHFWSLMRLRVTQPGIGQPYIASAIFSLIPIHVPGFYEEDEDTGERIYVPGTDTMGVDKNWRCYLDFDFMMEKGVVEASKFLNHEPWHLLRNHMARFDAIEAVGNDGVIKNHNLWNIAGDLSINDDLVRSKSLEKKAKLKDALLPKNIFYSNETEYGEHFEDDTTEEHYWKLIEFAKKQEQKQKGQDQSGGQGQSEGQGGGQGQSEGQGGGQGQSEGQGGGQGEGDLLGEKGLGQCGSGAGGAKNSFELPENSESAPIVSDSEGDYIRRRVVQEIKDYISAHGIGSVPGSVTGWVAEMETVKKPDWRKVLRGAVRSGLSWKAGQLDYNRSRRSRRHTNHDIIYPAMISPKPRITIGVDTSGSNLSNLGIVLDNIVDISKKAGVRGKDLIAFGVDTKADSPKFVNNPKNVLENFSGGGGTDMCVAFEVFAELGRKNKTDVCILITDLETGWPEIPPSRNVRYIVAGIVDNEYSHSKNYIQDAEKALAGWATLVIIESDKI